MWCGTLGGDDIRRAYAELKRQRAVIQAHFDNEMKQLDTKIADLETFECAFVNFVSTYKAEDGSSATVADPVQASALVSEKGPLDELGAPMSGDRRRTSRKSEIWSPTERALFTSAQPVATSILVLPTAAPSTIPRLVTRR